MTDPLASAARALREMHDGSSSDFALTRQRVLAKAALRRRRRRAFAAVWLPLAAVLAISSAWAAVSGRVPGLVARLRGQPPTALRAPKASPPIEPATTISAAPTPIEPPSAPSAAASTLRPSTPIVTAPVPSPSPAPQTPALPKPDLEETLYSAAHHAHFVAHDPAAALRAWDAYLASYPAGRFGLEARYNRALSLVRLGRTDEARTALAPFADGRSGGYRQAEAQSLLDALVRDH
jgi:hypothetical protein